MNVSMSTSRRITWSLRSSRTSCSIFIKPSQTWSIRRLRAAGQPCVQREHWAEDYEIQDVYETGAQPYGYRLCSDVWKCWFTFYLILAGTSWPNASLRLLHGRRQKPSLPWLVAVSDICSAEESEFIYFLLIWVCCLSVTDTVFIILYKELYYRHIYAKVSVSVFAHPSRWMTTRIFVNTQVHLSKLECRGKVHLFQ